jgi:hypothetical protein
MVGWMLIYHGTSDEIKLKGEFEDLWMNFIVWVVLIDNIK